MLDINLLIEERGGNPEIVRESQRKRYADVGLVDKVIDKWQDELRAKYALDQIKRRANIIQADISKLMKAKQDAQALIKERQDVKAEEAALEVVVKKKTADMYSVLKLIGNIIHESVPVSDNEDDNPVLHTWEPADRPTPVGKEDRVGLLEHHEVLQRLGGYNTRSGVKVSGDRGYFLKGWGVFLNQAIINYGLEFLTARRGFIPLQTPFMMTKETMSKTAQLEDFDDQLYKVSDGDQEKYLIATSEQPISIYHFDELIHPGRLPIKYAGYSTCFRREAGSGKDARGTFRVHQFEKIEQFVLCAPGKSYEMFDEMMENAEEFYKSLGLAYRVVAIVSGAFNNAASKKYDLEAWFPFQREYRELVSCSNCTDYQSRELGAQYNQKTEAANRKEFVHYLNSTLTATSRTMCAILENFQTPTGVKIPEPLRKYLPGAPDFLPYVEELEEPKTEATGGKKAPKMAKAQETLKAPKPPKAAKQKKAPKASEATEASAEAAAKDEVDETAEKLKDVEV